MITDPAKIKKLFSMKQLEMRNISQNKPKSKSRSLIYLKDANTRAGMVSQHNETHYIIRGDGIEEFLMGVGHRYSSAEELTFEYVLIDNLIRKETLSRLQKLKKLRALNLRHNNLRNYLEIVKFENLTLHRLNISHNPVACCNFVKSFIVYRFSDIKVFNGQLIRDKDMSSAKNIFSRFDKLLQRPTALPPSKKSGLSYKERARLYKYAGKAVWAEAKLSNHIAEKFDDVFQKLTQNYLDKIEL